MRVLMALSVAACLLAPHTAAGQNWYESSFWLLHEDHHTTGDRLVGRDADLEETSRLVTLCRPDMIQIHAKGNPGWTTYPTTIGHKPPQLQRDVLQIWRDVARRDGYHFSVYFNLGRDGEIMRRRPEWNRVQADGKPWDRALCYHSGVSEGYLWPMIREIMEGYAPDGFWFDGSCFTVRVCYCAKCGQRFRREAGLDLPQGPDDRGWTQFQEMQREIYRECVHDTCRLIHEIDPDCLVSVNWAYSLRMPEKPDEGIAYLTGDIGNRVEGLSAEAHWYDSTGWPFDLMTQINTRRAVTDPQTGAQRIETVLKPASQICQEMAVIVAGGGRFNAWDTPTPESGLSEERFQFMGDVVQPFLRERQPWCLGSERLPDVSLLHSAATHYAVGDKSTACFEKRDNRIEGAAAMLPRLHLNYEMVPDWRLAEGDVRGRLLIVEHAKLLAPETATALVRYVDRGGVLLLTGMSGGRHPALRKARGVDVLGGAQAPEPLTARVGELRLPMKHWLYRVGPTTAETVLEVLDAEGKTHPILTRNRHGRGSVYYAALPLLTPHGGCAVPPELMDAVFDAALPPEDRQLVVEAPQDVEVTLRSLGSQRIVHLVNMGEGARETVVAGGRRYVTIASIPPVPACRVSVEVSGRPKAVRLEPQSVDLAGWEYRDGRLTAQIPGFAMHQMVVIECE